jgi:uncharacterized linocin/CFP29 family protein
MDYLSRGNAPLSAQLWEQIDDTVVAAAKRVLTGRKFLHIYGPLGAGTQSVNIDEAGNIHEESADGLSIIKGRRFSQIPALYSDFTLLGKDLEAAAAGSVPADLTSAAAAAQQLAVKEDSMIFFGDKSAGFEGLLTAGGTGKIKMKDWKTGENAFTDIASALELLLEKGIYGSCSLVMSPDLFLHLQRLQEGTGMLEIDRISKLLDGHILRTPVLGKNRAVLVSTDAANIDIVVGQDIATAYLEQKDLNHSFRILETQLLRIKRKQAIVVFE